MEAQLWNLRVDVLRTRPFYLVHRSCERYDDEWYHHSSSGGRARVVRLGAYIPNKWTDICRCLRITLKDPLPIVHQRLTLDGGKELETNPTAAKTAIWTETWHPSWPIDDGVAGGGGPGGGRGGGSRGGTSPSYGSGLESSGKGGGNFKSVPRPKGRGCVGSTNNGMMATLCFEPFDRTTADPISFYPVSVS